MEMWIKKTAAILNGDKTFAVGLSEKIQRLAGKYHLNLAVDIFVTPERFDQYQKSYDVLFLDVVLPECDGISLAKYWKNTGRFEEVIFVSEEEGQVFRAQEAGSLMFVRKAHLEDDLECALARYAGQVSLPVKMVQIWEGKRIHFFIPEDIMYVYSGSHYLDFYLKDGSKTVIRGKLSDVQTILSEENFMRIHVRCLMDIRYISSVDINRKLIWSRDRRSHRISPAYRQAVFERLQIVRNG